MIGRSELRPADNVVLADSAPHRELMSQAAVVVTHGGHGTVMKALAAGKPLLIVPHGRDQDDNAGMLEEIAGATPELPLEPFAGVDSRRASSERARFMTLTIRGSR